MPSTRRRFLAGAAGAGAAALASPARAADVPTLTWSRTYAPTDDGERALVRDVVPAGDGFALVGLAGDHRYRGWVGGVDAAGRPEWHRLLGAERTALLAGVPATDDADDVVAAGVTNQSRDLSEPDHPDPYVARVEPGGEVASERTYQPDVPRGRANAVVGTGDGYVLAGDAATDGVPRPWAVGLDASGTARWEWTDETERAGDANGAVAVDGGVVVAGSTWPRGAESPSPRGRLEAAWAAKVTRDGETAWRWSVDREGGDRVEALAPAPDGDVVAVGRRGFSTDDEGVGWLVALDDGGEPRWERTYPQAAWNWHRDVAAVGDGYVLAGTREERPGAERRGAWLLRVDAEGRTVWDYQAESGTCGFAVRALPDGGLLVAGDGRVEAGDGEGAWLSKAGGDPAPSAPSGDGLGLPALPPWTEPFLAGGAVGVLGAGAAAYLRRKWTTDNG